MTFNLTDMDYQVDSGKIMEYRNIHIRFRKTGQTQPKIQAESWHLLDLDTVYLYK